MLPLTLILSIVAAQNPPVQTFVNHTQECNTYRDCYKCVLSNCGWRWDFDENAGIDACF